MTLYLVHHGVAAESGVDPQRPLTAEGHAAVTALAADALLRGVHPDVIWHSGKLRARQTAEIFWRACTASPLTAPAPPQARRTAPPIAQRALQPSDPPEWAADLILAELHTTPGLAGLMIVGHLPHLPRLRAQLLRLPLPLFPLNGMVAFEWNGQAWNEQWELRPTARG